MGGGGRGGGGGAGGRGRGGRGGGGGVEEGALQDLMQRRELLLQSAELLNRHEHPLLYSLIHLQLSRCYAALGADVEAIETRSQQAHHQPNEASHQAAHHETPSQPQGGEAPTPTQTPPKRSAPAPAPRRRVVGRRRRVYTQSSGSGVAALEEVEDVPVGISDAAGGAGPAASGPAAVGSPAGLLLLLAPILGIRASWASQGGCTGFGPTSPTTLILSPSSSPSSSL